MARVGVTLHSPDPESPEAQSAVFLAMALARCPQVDSVRMVVTGSGATGEVASIAAVPLDGCRDDLDLVVEASGRLGPVESEFLKARGTRVVLYAHTPEYVLEEQAILFGRPRFGSSLFVNLRFDAIWIAPQARETSESYFATLYRRSVAPLPFIWEPCFVDGWPAYRPGGAAKRITVHLPNVDVTRYCFYPILVAEEAFRLEPQLFSFLHVTHAEHLATRSKAFVALMSQLDLVHRHKVSFVRPMRTPEALGDFTDILVSHSWGVPLAYQELEACWLGYPVVHNASLCPGIGYSYPGNDVDVGATQLVRAMKEHDAAWEDYAARQRELIAPFRADAPDTTARLAELLDHVLSGPPA